MLTASKKMSTRTMVKTSVLSVLAFLIMYFEMPLWFTPPFLKVDLSDIPALIGAFSLGPVAGVVIELIKNILNVAIEGTTTGAVGELANFFVGGIFVFVAGVIYKKDRTFKGAIIGMLVATVAMTAAASILNYYFLIPFYAKLFGAPVETFVEMGSKVNKYVTDYRSFILFGIVPFNFLKGIMVSAITIPLYKRVSPILHR
ncbi:Riboflavin transporter FmnP [Proteiniborus ethanoligenes]|uniref:Riboflavin transporter n=1 Tax=Proteiniborus ethanoligenes TaxID=415015 RepID=A0A1H3QYW9_9FIRM|nr:ECF transporter S component [Proteiniborus ethanoligenes]SDZ18148.1 Riboflavin transporter FmnP [Proteiniborus ethanoligenes]